MDKFFYVFIWCLFITESHARTLPSEAIAVGIAVLLFPPVIGAIIAGKNNIWWFTKVSMFVYIATWAFAKFIPGQTTIYFFFFLPYILLPISIYKKYKSRDI